jgi:hypothetical protein
MKWKAFRFQQSVDTWVTLANGSCFLKVSRELVCEIEASDQWEALRKVREMRQVVDLIELAERAIP